MEKFIRASAFAAVSSNGLLAIFTLSGIRAHFQPHSFRFSLLRASKNFAMEKTLSSIYLDPSQPASFGGLGAVYRAVKEKGKSKISCEQVQDWLSQQDVYTLHKPARRHYKRSRVIVPGIDAQF